MGLYKRNQPMDPGCAHSMCTLRSVVQILASDRMTEWFWGITLIFLTPL